MTQQPPLRALQTVLHAMLAGEPWSVSRDTLLAAQEALQRITEAKP